MSLAIANLVRNGIALAFSLTPDVQIPMTYRRVRGSAYNGESGEVAPLAQDVAVTVIISAYSEDEVDGVNIQIGDEKAVISFAELRTGGIDEFALTDVLIQSGVSDRNIIHGKLDPTGQVLILQVRKLATPVVATEGASS